MKLFSKAEPEGISREESLSCVPLVSPEVKAEPREDGGLRLSYPITFKPWFSGFASRFGLWRENQVNEKKLDLDEMGRFSFELIDKRREVREIAALLAKRYQLTKPEAEASLGLFLRELGKRGIIVLVKPKR